MCPLSLLPFDLAEIVQNELERERREKDGLAHPSSHLTGSLRHTQLDIAGAPKVTSELVRQMPLWIGNALHEDIHRMLRKVGIPYMAEVILNPWLPPGWGGRADAIVWNPDLKAFVLADFKTSKGESMKWLLRDGAKEEHVRQASAYWHAVRKMFAGSGVSLAKAIGVWYLPKNDTRSKDELIEPVLMDFEPIPARELHREMKQRWGRVSAYEDSLPFLSEGKAIREGRKDEAENGLVATEDFLTDELEPVQERTQRVYYDRNTETHEVKLVPHWSAAFCEFPEVLCSCSTQGTTKIGFYDIDGEYIPRRGFEDIEPTVEPPS